MRNIINMNKVGTLIDLLSKSYQVETAIIDKECNNLWGTPRFNKHIGSTVPNKCIAAKVFSTGEELFVKDLKKNTLCNKCYNLPGCLFTIGIYLPVVLEDAIVATLCILGCEEKQKNKFLRYGSDIKKAGITLSSVIGSSLGYDNMKQANRLLFLGMETLVEHPNQIILITDSCGEIVQVNETALNYFKAKRGDLIGKNLDNVFKEMDANSQVLSSTNCRKIKLSNAIQKSNYENNSQIGHLILISNTISNNRGTGKTSVHGIDKRYSFEDILGQSDAISKVKKLAQKIAVTDSTVLIQGETGVGKELFARGIHRASKRCDAGLITVNCSAIPNNLLESEFFGFEEGSFTGAKKGGKIGKFEQADKGTIFLDEIGDLSLELQAKLLRTLETGEIQRIGSTTIKHVDVRLIAATNRDLHTMVGNGTFRQDLFYRLNVVPLFIPPLRQRPEDVSILLEAFMETFRQKLLHTKVKSFSSEAVALLEKYAFPGNVRELFNIVEYVMMTEEQEIVHFKNFSHLLQNVQQDIHINGKSARGLKKREIEQALALFGTSTDGKQKAAKHLGISLSTLYRRMRALGS